MKKTVLVLLVLTGFVKIADAQKGSWLVYGNAGFSSTSDTFNFKSDSYAITPGIGYQFSSNWTAGLNFSFGGSRSEAYTGTAATVPNGSYNTTSFFNVGPFLRYSHSISDVFSIYGQAEVNYLSGKSSPYNLDSYTYKGFGADFFPAIGVNIKNGFALNLSFGGISYQTKKYTGNTNVQDIAPTSNANQFAITFGQGATFGISKNFGGGKTKK